MKKHGFTLAEILIVLTIIGVMAVMTIPSLVQNSNSQLKIAMFKKSFNAVSNAYATEFAVKSAPNTRNNVGGYHTLHRALQNQLNVEYYINFSNGKKDYVIPEDEVDLWHYGIYTTDKIRYLPQRGVAENCNLTRLELNSFKSTEELNNNTCLAVEIRIPKGKSAMCSDDVDLNNLNCNGILFFVAKDGITAGNPDCTIAGRIMSDNVTYDSAKCAEGE